MPDGIVARAKFKSRGGARPRVAGTNRSMIMTKVPSTRRVRRPEGLCAHPTDFQGCLDVLLVRDLPSQGSHGIAIGLHHTSRDHETPAALVRQYTTCTIITVAL